MVGPHLVPEIRGSNLIIGKIYTEHLLTVYCIEKTKKMLGMANFKNIIPKVYFCLHSVHCLCTKKRATLKRISWHGHLSRTLQPSSVPNCDISCFVRRHRQPQAAILRPRVSHVWSLPTSTCCSLQICQWPLSGLIATTPPKGSWCGIVLSKTKIGEQSTTEQHTKQP